MITVVNIDRGKVRLGIEAPRSVNIARAELVQAGVMAAYKEKLAREGKQ